jgi:hypothetical protein
VAMQDLFRGSLARQRLTKTLLTIILRGSISIILKVFVMELTGA